MLFSAKTVRTEGDQKDMEHKVIRLKCPGCGAAVSLEQRECEYCQQPLVISTFQSVGDMPLLQVNKYAGAYRAALAENPENIVLNKSAAFCYLKLKLYDRAQSAFDRAIEENFDDADLYFYAAICLLKGKRPFLAPRKTLDQAVSYLEAALMIEPKGIYHYFSAYLKYDYYELKHLRIEPGYGRELQSARGLGVTESDKQQLFALLGVQRPVGF